MLDTGLDTGEWLVVRLLLLQCFHLCKHTRASYQTDKYTAVVRYAYFYTHVSLIRNDTYI